MLYIIYEYLDFLLLSLSEISLPSHMHQKPTTVQQGLSQSGLCSASVGLNVPYQIRVSKDWLSKL